MPKIEIWRRSNDIVLARRPSDGKWLVLRGYLELERGGYTQTHQFSTDHPMKAWWNYWDALSEVKSKSFAKQLQDHGLDSVAGKGKAPC
ncbi:MAG: hypothetical protein ACK5LX_02820 [Oscillospiraceae bacterium]